MLLVKCVKCGADLGPAEKICPVCGTPRSSEGQVFPGLPPETCDVLKKAADSLYFAYENPSPAMDPGSYEKLYTEVVDLAEKLGCKID